ncbi:MAG: BA14K family protein [Bradyrhizobium sp.]
MTYKSTSMMIVLLLTTISAGGIASAQDYSVRPLRYGNTSGGHFDARNDARDFPSNGFFPGNFAANPAYASVGAAGFLESNPYRSALPYPSQVYFGPRPGRSGSCRHRYRSVRQHTPGRC